MADHCLLELQHVRGTVNFNQFLMKLLNVIQHFTEIIYQHLCGIILGFLLGALSENTNM